MSSSVALSVDSETRSIGGSPPEEEITPEEEKVPEPSSPPPLVVFPHTERLLTIMNSVEQHFMAHLYSAWVFPILDKLVKVPITLLTLVTGTSMWSSRALTHEWFLALGTIQGIIITLMVIQFYYEFETRAHHHSMNATQLANLYRRLHHQWFKHERRIHGLPPWGASLSVQPTDPLQIHYKWMMFFERIDTEYKDVQEQPIMAWITRQIEEWTSYSLWIRYSIFLYFHSFIIPTPYSLSQIVAVSVFSKSQLLAFIQWYRSQLFMTPRVQVTYMAIQDLQCMNKQMLLFHLLIELNIPFHHFLDWNSTLRETYHSSGPLLSYGCVGRCCCRRCTVSTCHLFLCWINEATILQWYQHHHHNT